MAIVVSSTYGTLTILPLPPASPIEEKLEWKTDIIESFNGTEQQLQVRGAPRQSFNFNIPVNFSTYALAYNSVYSALDKQWAIPVWTEAQNIGVVVSGASFLAAITDVYDFRDSSMAFLWQDETTYQLLEISTVVSGTLNLSNTTNGFSSAWLMPLRVGYLNITPRRKTNSYNGLFELNFEIQDNQDISVSAPTQYLSNDIYYAENFFKTSVEDTFTKEVILIDEELGLVDYYSPLLNPKTTRPFYQILANVAEVYNFKQFLHRRKGKYIPFWSPTFDNDIRITSIGQITTTVNIREDSYFFTEGTPRTHIAFKDINNSWFPRTITNAVDLGGGIIQLTIDASLNINATDILQTSYLGLRRLNTDAVQLDWVGNGVVESTIGMLELTP